MGAFQYVPSRIMILEDLSTHALGLITYPDYKRYLLKTCYAVLHYLLKYIFRKRKIYNNHSSTMEMEEFLHAKLGFYSDSKFQIRSRLHYNECSMYRTIELIQK